MLINGDGLVWVGRRLPKWQGDRSAYIWQMPQGGITAGEAAEVAALRELEEETACTRSMFWRRRPAGSATTCRTSCSASR